MDTQFLTATVPLVAGYVLDLLLGDPRWFPHPVVYYGKAIAFGDRNFNTSRFRLIKGAAYTLLLVILTYLLFYITGDALKDTSFFWPFAIVCVFAGLANKTLIAEGKQVILALKEEGLEAGRKQVSRIVGRDTSVLTENKIKIAVLETLSENLNDGVIAPLFYYIIGGVPAMMTYKMINTLDSMIGYKNEKYFLYGRFAARLDDVANYIPARLTAWLMVLVTWNKRAGSFIFRYGSNHASPNSGFPEAALAGILNCRFGGPNVYQGKLLNKPYIGEEEKTITDEDVFRAAHINHRVTFTAVCIGIAVNYLLYV